MFLFSHIQRSLTLRRLARRAETALRTLGPDLPGHDSLGGPVRMVRWHRLKTVLVAELCFARGRRRVIVKPFVPGPSASTEDLAKVHERLRQLGPALALSLPWIRPGGPDWIIQEYLPGCSLHHHLLQALRGRGDKAACRTALQDTATLMEQIHRVNGGDLDLHRPPQPNAQYIEGLQRPWERLLGRAGRRVDVAALAAAAGVDFAHRTGKAVMIQDSQPKNIILADQGRPCCIDIDYLVGNPAMALAHFLVSLDRLALLHSAAARQVEQWQALFVQAYGQAGAAQNVLRDLVFFYPWVFIRQALLHAQARPLLAPLLRRQYRRRLQRYLATVETCGHAVAAEDVCSLFATNTGDSAPAAAPEPSISDSARFISPANRAVQV